MSLSLFKGGWFKTIVGTLTGLFSGAFVMYFTPWLKKIEAVVAPAKPVANFAAEYNGMTVTFHNRSTGGTQGRWDFGDGSPLEFVKADHSSVSHAYSRPGVYQAKFTLMNFIGDQDERNVTIEVAPSEVPASTEKPVIEDLFARPPVKAGQRIFAPATFQVEATVQDAEHFIWDFGDDQGIQMGDRQATHTFEKPGTYRITLIAFNGKEKCQQTVDVQVDAPPVNALVASMQVSTQGISSRKREVTASHSVMFDDARGASTIEQTVTTPQLYEIAKVERKSSASQNVTNLQYQLAPDRKSVKVTGQVIRGKGPGMALLSETLVLTEQRKVKSGREPIAMKIALTAPGSARLQLPWVAANWQDVQRQYQFELRKGSKVIWQGTQLPQNAPINYNGQTYYLTAETEGEEVNIQLVNRVVSR
jgi:PKD repeat protein